jgi:hypothetical protein
MMRRMTVTKKVLLKVACQTVAAPGLQRLQKRIKSMPGLRIEHH